MNARLSKLLTVFIPKRLGICHAFECLNTCVVLVACERVHGDKSTKLQCPAMVN